MIKRIVLLGNTGFIGRHLEKVFKNSLSQAQVIGQSLPVLDLTKLEDAQKLADVFDIDTAVIMCAAIKRQFGDNLEVFDQNLNMASNVCRVLEKNPVKRFIFFSSSAVYGEDIHNTHITEETPVCPTSYYGLAKYTAERLYAKTIGSQKESSLVVLRPPLIYGPGDLGKTYGPSGFIKAALNNEPVTLWGDGMELREFIFVEDIVRVVCGLLDSDFNGVVNVASGKSHTFQDVLKIVSDLVGEALDIKSLARTKDKVDNAFDNTHFTCLMPGLRFTPLEEGMRETFNMEAILQGQAMQGAR
jgi:UDP-glucose 4-epimerase